MANLLQFGKLDDKSKRALALLGADANRLIENIDDTYDMLTADDLKRIAGKGQIAPVGGRRVMFWFKILGPNPKGGSNDLILEIYKLEILP